MLDFATLWNRSKRFIDRAVDDLYDVGAAGGDGSRLVKEDVVEKAFADASEATIRRAVR